MLSDGVCMPMQYVCVRSKAKDLTIKCSCARRPTYTAQCIISVSTVAALPENLFVVAVLGPRWVMGQAHGWVPVTRHMRTDSKITIAQKRFSLSPFHFDFLL